MESSPSPCKLDHGGLEPNAIAIYEEVMYRMLPLIHSSQKEMVGSIALTTSILLTEEIRTNHLGWCENLVNNGINLQYQLVITGIFSPSTKNLDMPSDILASTGHCLNL